jgi:proteasome accessory factor B
MPPREPKLQRWTDLIAALLKRRYPAAFEEIADDVPAYSLVTKKRDAVMRMFERDKDELRAFGISIETVPFEDDDGDQSGYKLDRRHFYLPFLSLSSRGGKRSSTPRHRDRYGYRALASLVFEPDELETISHAAQRVRALGDPVLTEEADSAIRKLSFDLPVPAADSPFITAGTAAEEVFEALNDALKRRKRVRFEYRAMSTDQVATRNVEPYGLFFLSAHWYLAGHDADRAELRNFRLSRVSNVVANASKAQSADFEIPKNFSLRAHAQSRKPWELGEGDTNEALVDFAGESGATKAAARLGVAVEGAPDRRKFRIRRMDSFARWLLSFGGEAIPVAPEPLVAEFRKLLRATQAVYGGSQ